MQIYLKIIIQKKKIIKQSTVQIMDFSDELPCGGYEQQDKKIETNLHKLSLQSEGIHIEHQIQKQCGQGCQNKCTGGNCCGSCGCVQKQNTKNCTKQQCKKEQEILITALKPKKNIPCKKCKQNQSVLIHKNQQICKECLLKNIEYKTRLTLQNNIKVKSKSKLLICFSGGLNSICMVQILVRIKQRYQKSPLFGQIQCVHVQQQENLPEGYVDNFQKITGIKLNIVAISDIYKCKSQNQQEPIVQQQQEKNFKNFKDIVKLFTNLPKNTNTIDLLTIFRNKLITQYANLHKFDYILMGKNGQSLASEIFKYFVKGIGGNIQQLNNYGQNKFVYPLKQHLQKQLQYYFYVEKLSNLSMLATQSDLSNLAHNEIDDFLDQFITTLQDRYSHTAPAIVRTGQKIKSNFQLNHTKACNWCALDHDREGKLCQKCIRLWEGIQGQNKNKEEIKELLPQWMLQ